MKPVEKKAAEVFHCESLYFVSGALAREVEKLAKQTWKPSGLHPSHAHLLLFLLYNGMSFPTFLSKELLMSPSTITRLLQKLEKKGLVTRIPYDHMMCISTTNKARELEPILEQCEKDFKELCSRLLGHRPNRLTLVLNKATDLLAKRTIKPGAVGAAEPTGSMETPGERGSGQSLPQQVGKPFL
jgi:DNA-binding MarR family transcriptional regulator